VCAGAPPTRRSGARVVRDGGRDWPCPKRLCPKPVFQLAPEVLAEPPGHHCSQEPQVPSSVEGYADLARPGSYQDWAEQRHTSSREKEWPRASWLRVTLGTREAQPQAGTRRLLPWGFLLRPVPVKTVAGPLHPAAGHRRRFLGLSGGFLGASAVGWAGPFCSFQRACHSRSEPRNRAAGMGSPPGLGEWLSSRPTSDMLSRSFLGFLAAMGPRNGQAAWSTIRR
jgi:hypothetical protein